MAFKNPIGGSPYDLLQTNQVEIVCRGLNPGDRPEEFPGCMSVLNPATDSRAGYPNSDRPFITNIVAPTAQAACETSFPPDYGMQVLVQQDAGMPTSKMVTGCIPSKLTMAGIPGNYNPIVGLREALRTELEKVMQKPELTEKMDNGALVKEAREKGNFKMDLLKGLPTHGSLPMMTGHIQEQIKNIETAVQNFFSIPGLGFDLSGLGGSGMKMSNLKAKMTNEQKKKLEESVSPEMLDAIYSLLPFISISPARGYVTDGLVDEETFIDNAVTILSRCKTQEDLLDKVYDIFTRTGIRGLSNIDRISTEVETPYGNLTVRLTSSGEVSLSSNSANTLADNMKSTVSAMTSTQTSLTQNLFGEAASAMSELFSRIPNNIRQQLVQSVSTQYKQKGHQSANIENNKGNYPW